MQLRTRIFPVLFFRIILPIVLLIAFIVRFCFFSLVYGLLLLIWPFIPNISRNKVPGCTKNYLVACTVLSAVYSIAQFIYHVTVYGMAVEGGHDYNCTEFSDILKAIGLQRLNETDVGATFRSVGPDVAVCIVAIITTVLCYLYKTQASTTTLPTKIEGTNGGASHDQAPTNSQQPQPTEGQKTKPQKRSQRIFSCVRNCSVQFLFCLLRLSDIIVVVLLVLIAAIWPCLISVTYFVLFVLILTWWASYLPLKRYAFNCFKIFLLIYCGAHILLLYTYQIVLQTAVFKEYNEKSSNQFITKLIGLIALINESSCEDFYSFNFASDATWPAFLNPIFLIIFYIYCAFQYLFTSEGISLNRFNIREREYDGVTGIRDDESSVHEELLGTEEEDDESVRLTENQQQGDNAGPGGPTKPPQKRLGASRQFSRLLSFALNNEKGEYKCVAMLLAFIVRHSYALALVSMMAWAITFHAWLSFVWLLTACIIWLIPDSRKWCLRFSPLFLIYAIILLCLEFIYGIRSAIAPYVAESWPVQPSGINLQQIGLITPAGAACKPLLLKIIYSIPFWLLMRLFLRENYYTRRNRHDPTSYGTFTLSISQPSMVGSSWFGRVLVKYWIYVVGLVLLLISIRQPVVAYGVCYMAFFIVLITVLQMSFRFWRVILYPYWIVLISFSIFVLLIVYTYQFHSIPDLWRNLTHWPNGSATNDSINVFKDLGLVSYDSASLFMQLLTPISFLIVICMQLKFFHAGFMKMTNMSALLEARNPLDAMPDSAPQSAKPLSKWAELALHYLQWTVNFLWRLAEIHIAKVVSLAFILIAVYEVNAVNLGFVLLASIMVPCRRLSMLVSFIACIWAAVIVLSRMLIQMSFVEASMNETIKSGNACDYFTQNNMTNITDAARWAGFQHTDNIAHYLKSYVYLFLLLTFQAIVYLRQKYHRVCLNEMTPARGIVFPLTTRRDADESLTKCLQYLVNYAFYKFGVELTFIVMVIDIAIRMDGVALLYSFLLLFLVCFSLKRHILARFWYFFVLFMAIAIPVQYAVCIGFPSFLCVRYPWDVFHGSNTTDYENLFVWLYFPDYRTENAPNPYALVPDFFIFLLACCQLYVFNIELSSNGENFEGGDNAPIEYRMKTKQLNFLANPVPNFITYTRSFLDILKTGVFVYFHWITLTVVFVAGVGGISLFSLGYLLGAFIILWKGNDLYTETMKRIKFRWRALLFYNLFAIILKIALQIVGCVFIADVCNRRPFGNVFIQLFSITCLRGAHKPHMEGILHEGCKVSAEEAELIYDAFVFAFVIFQLRIFSSWYFKHTIAELNAERILSYRGAMLMNQLIKKEMKEQEEKEGKIYEKLIAKTNRIRDKYVKQLEGKDIFEAQTYHSAKRAGDYYMFDYETEDEDYLELEAPKDSVAPEISPETQVTGVGPLQLAHIAVSRNFDIKDAYEEAQKADKKAKKASKDKLAKKSRTGSDKGTDSGDAEESSEAEEVSEIEESDPTRRHSSSGMVPKKYPGRVKTMTKFLIMCLKSVPDHCAFWFNKWSRDYRYVAHVLRQEKKLLKETLAAKQPDETTINVKQIRETIFRGDLGHRIHLVKSESEIDSIEKEVYRSWMQHNVWVRFAISVFYLVLSHTELLCYVMMILDHMVNASVISLPLPLFVFLWGTLCSPRPPQFFWVSVVTYTMAMIVVKFIAQFAFFHGGEVASNDPYAPLRILGLERGDYYAAWDVALLMILFFHRYVLKALGLWKVEAADAQFAHKVERAESKETAETDVESPSSKEEIKGQEDASDKDAAPGTSAGTAPEPVEKPVEAKANKKCRLAYCHAFTSFYERLLNPPYRYIMDLYSSMFLCDLICFLVLTFGYSSFGVAVGKTDVVADIKSNKVPLAFVAMLIALMILIIIDRGLYLRKTVVGKLIYQYILVIFVHIWIFFGLPAITDNSVWNNPAAQIWYLIKCVYFLLSAWQIRNGYPSRIFGNLLTKRFNLLNYSLFTAFMIAPFLFELRTLIDWIWTETCMPLFDFFTLENIYAVIYRIKCMRKMEKDYPTARGIPKSMVVKYGMGCPLLLIIILLLWLPLLLFALVNAIGLPLLPERAHLSIAIEGYPPLYTMDAQQSYLAPLTSLEYESLRDKFKNDKVALTFLREYSNSDALKAVFRSPSNNDWGISPPSKQALVNDLLNEKQSVDMSISYEFSRPRESFDKEPMRQTGLNSLKLDKTTREQMATMINGSNSDTIRINFVFPHYIYIPSMGKIQPVRELLSSQSRLARSYDKMFNNISASLSGGTGQEHWTVKGYYTKPVGKEIVEFTDEIIIFCFVDKVFPSAFDKVTSGGILGVYLVVVLAAGRLIRNLVVNSPLDLIMTEIPNVDRILQLCMDIFLVREARDFILELDLYAKLVFLFRSPETLVRWTRPKKD